MAQDKNKTIEEMTIFEKADAFANLAIYPALGSMVFTRKRLGYRTVKPGRILGTAILLATAGYLVQGGGQQDPRVILGGKALMVYSAAMLGAGILHRLRGWNGFLRGEVWHTYSRGVPRLSVALTPILDKTRFRSLLFHLRVQRYIEPALLAIMAVIVTYFLPPFGLWLLFSAMCVRAHEEHRYAKEMDAILDKLDQFANARTQNELVMGPRQEAGLVNQPLPRMTVGQPVGIAPDIEARIAAMTGNGGTPPELPPSPAWTQGARQAA